ncbi:MAG: ABC transporter permease [Clostridiales bacterium]|nr:ABC transporter permease [Roseburia sp.]MDD7636043.1 ABC transporter permease [Clostridiales bacterium]MDY4112676.1 ABC transporter permease [Roseburia sp.]
MYRSLLINDLRKNRFSNLVVTMFMSLAVALLISGMVLTGQVWSSIQSLYEVAQPPHFLQMHKGEFNQEDIDAFNENYKGIVDWQTVAMIDIYGDEIAVAGKNGSVTLKDCSLDIGLVKQNPRKDLLLNANREKIVLSKGEMAVPVILKSTYGFSVGDRVTIAEKDRKKEFVITDFVYDAQMNSTMCSSTRFLISDADFDELQGQIGEMEYIIEAWFENTDMASDYQAAYEQDTAQMPRNGQAVTYSMIFLLSALTDLIFAFLIFLVSALILVIAFICMKYTLLATMQEDLKEIGTMKAIGIPHEAIKKLYLGKMELLLGAGTVLGFLISMLLSGKGTTHMTDTFGKQPLSAPTILLAVFIGVCTYVITVAFCSGVIGKTKKLNVVHTIVNGEGLRERKYGLIFGVMFMVSAMITLPVWIVHTMEDNHFVTYAGFPVSDILIEVPQGEQLEERNETLADFLSKEKVIYEVNRRVRLETCDADGKKKSIHIDTGMNAGAGIAYLNGGCPQNTDEIALSKLQADLLGKEVGDAITLFAEDSEYTFRVCGIYQDVTSGGYTAKAKMDFPGLEAENYSYTIDIEDGRDADAVTEQWKGTLGNGYTILPMDRFVSQTLGGVVSQVEGVCNLVVFIAVVLTAMIVFLFLRLRIVREASQIAIQKAMGLTCGRIQKRELKDLLWVALLGVLTGNMVTVMFGDDVASMIFRVLGLGIERLKFPAELSVRTALLPYLPLAVVAVVGMAVLQKIKEIQVIEYLNAE